MNGISAKLTGIHEHKSQVRRVIYQSTATVVEEDDEQ